MVEMKVVEIKVVEMKVDGEIFSGNFIGDL